MKFKRIFFVYLGRYTVAEVVSMLEVDDFQSTEVFILPPEDPARSDEDSGQGYDDSDIDNLTGNQLRAEAEATIVVSGFEKKRLNVNDSNPSDGSSEKLC